jgi:hypothetical protein
MRVEMSNFRRSPAANDEDGDMQISAPKVKYELNMTTAVVTIGLCATFAGWGVVWGSLTTRIDNYENRNNAWQANHEQLHKERATAIATTDARTDQRLTGHEVELRKIDNLSYRLTVQEQGSATLAKSVDELKTAVQSQGSDIRFIREMLTQSNPGVKPARSQNGP